MAVDINIVKILEIYKANNSGPVIGPRRSWYAGITDSPSRRRGEHGNPSLWYAENAHWEERARDTEKYLQDHLGYGGAGGGGINPTHVYIYAK